MKVKVIRGYGTACDGMTDGKVMSVQGPQAIVYFEGDGETLLPVDSLIEIKA